MFHPVSEAHVKAPPSSEQRRSCSSFAFKGPHKKRSVSLSSKRGILTSCNKESGWCFEWKLHTHILIYITSCENGHNASPFINLHIYLSIYLSIYLGLLYFGSGGNVNICVEGKDCQQGGETSSNDSSSGEFIPLNRLIHYRLHFILQSTLDILLTMSNCAPTRQL